MLTRFLVVDGRDDDLSTLTTLADEAAAAIGAVPGVVFKRKYQGYPFSADATVPLDLRLVAVCAWADDGVALDRAWTATRPLAARADEAWEVLLEPALSTGGGSWDGFSPSTERVRALLPEEPVLVMIAATLLPQHAEAFAQAGARIVAQADAFPDYLGGCALTETGAETISFSCWRSAAAARTFAFGAGAHREGMQRDRSGAWHDAATEVFVRFRPLASRGTLFGANPFAGLLPES